jgi:hypothetical protein
MRGRLDRASRHGGRLILALGALALLVGLGYFALVRGPELLVDENGLSADAIVKAENDVRGTLVQGLAGLALLIGLYFTARTYAASKTSQITERFSRAIAQLGEAEINVRIGALYALESIGHDSPRTHRTVIELITRFIRERADTTDQGAPYDDYAVEVGGDVRVAIELLGRRRHHRHEAERIQFRELVLPGVQLDGNYDAADFCYAHFDSSALTHSSFRNAHFGWGSFHGVFFTNSDLRNASFYLAHLEGAYFLGADLREATLNKSDLSGAVLGATDAAVRPARVDGADFSGAEMAGTLLQGIDLSKAIGLTQEQIDESETDDKTVLPALGTE